ncbi:hypothetical protein LOC68_17215 [Blastopirellula sp. JC732]|uniref:Uncharacterized protein n=1 Tax=Blastopirellula sediminis TaxID=2894196 RepID=A0A9X1MP51_9BACT|nr:hypothetical protein [Blastopirellula sediminis]MCC9606566.1 hypothetical protein [Blastopirellula sediminis]MCC9630136.1 hypothetical protein [Blastopirellula sediminis]
MRESLKPLVALVLMISLVLASVAWYVYGNDPPTPTLWLMWIGTPLLSIVCCVALLLPDRRQNLAEDFLTELHGEFLNRNGFCFSVGPAAEAGLCYIYVFYQNQFANRSIGRVAIRPARGFWMTRPDFPTICVDVAMEPGEYGWVRMPMPVPTSLQGKQQAFEVGAAVSYPEGKGIQLRFAEGILLRTNSEFNDAFQTALVVAANLTGQFMAFKPTMIKLQLPTGVASELTGEIRHDRQTIWTYSAPAI